MPSISDHALPTTETFGACELTGHEFVPAVTTYIESGTRSESVTAIYCRKCGVARRVEVARGEAERDRLRRLLGEVLPFVTDRDSDAADELAERIRESIWRKVGDDA